MTSIRNNYLAFLYNLKWIWNFARFECYVKTSTFSKKCIEFSIVSDPSFISRKDKMHRNISVSQPRRCHEYVFSDGT